MVSNRRMGSEDSPIRTALVDAATELMRTEGHGAVTVRRVAEHADVKWQNVHYFFQSMEELFQEVVRRSAQRYLDRQKKALARPDPLRAIWELATNPDGIRLEFEFMALANRFPSVRKLLADFTSRSREMQVEALLLTNRDTDRMAGGANLPKPEAMVFAMRGLARALVIEASYGVTLGHKEALEAINDFLATVEGGEAEHQESDVTQ